jgi:hypothetical protein
MKSIDYREEADGLRYSGEIAIITKVDGWNKVNKIAHFT